jgi:hypothetical protein
MNLDQTNFMLIELCTGTKKGPRVKFSSHILKLKLLAMCIVSHFTVNVEWGETPVLKTEPNFIRAKTYSKKISTSAGADPRSRVCARKTLNSAPNRH